MAEEESCPSLYLHGNVLPSSTAIEGDRVTIKQNNPDKPKVTFGSHGDGCSCINIYINSNVQGVNNSTVIDSKVASRDPGVHLHLSLPRSNSKLPQHCKRKKRRVRPGFEPPTKGYSIVYLFCLVFFILVLFFIN